MNGPFDKSFTNAVQKALLLIFHLKYPHSNAIIKTSTHQRITGLAVTRGHSTFVVVALEGKVKKGTYKLYSRVNNGFNSTCKGSPGGFVKIVIKSGDSSLLLSGRIGNAISAIKSFQFVHAGRASGGPSAAPLTTNQYSLSVDLSNLQVDPIEPFQERLLENVRTFLQDLGVEHLEFVRSVSCPIVLSTCASSEISMKQNSLKRIRSLLHTLCM